MNEVKLVEVTETFNLYTETFISLEENEHGSGEQFGHDNFANMDERGKKLYHWVYPPITKRSFCQHTHNLETRILAQQEESGMYD